MVRRLVDSRVTLLGSGVNIQLLHETPDGDGSVADYTVKNGVLR